MNSEELTEYVQKKFQLVCKECKGTNVLLELLANTGYVWDIKPSLLHIKCRDCHNEVDEFL